MKGATPIKNKSRVKMMQIQRRDLLADIEEAEYAIELSRDLAWPKSHIQERSMRQEIARLRDEIHHLDRAILKIQLIPVLLRECAA